MSDLDKFKELVDDVWEIVFGTKRRLQVKDRVDVTKSLYNDMATTREPERARTKGRYKGDDLTTKGYNEAWVGGKAPKKRKK
tara:strand:+ start:295 stop:540 length:246 start_codon:yes stop_codon:yes gene_type:complete